MRDLEGLERIAPEIKEAGGVIVTASMDQWSELAQRQARMALGMTMLADPNGDLVRTFGLEDICFGEDIARPAASRSAAATSAPQAAARPAAGCPAAAHRLPGPDGRFERAQRKTRGSRQARRGTWPPPTPSAEVELSTARNGALTSRYGIERTETAFKRLVTPANTAPARRALVPVPRRLRAALPSCRPA